MEEDKQTRRVTIRLTPYQARRLWKLRTADLAEGRQPRTVTEVLVRALLDASRATEQNDNVSHEDNSNFGDESANREIDVELHSSGAPVQ